jgi:ribonuclease R
MQEYRMPSNKSAEDQQLLEKKILKLLSKMPLFLPGIFKALKVKKKKDYKYIQRVVKKLERKKFIIADRRGLFKLVSDQKNIRGKISISAQGYGFVTPLIGNDDPDIFIPVKHVNGAFDGDIVDVRIIPDDPRRKKRSGLGAVGVVNDIVKRKRPFIVGELKVKRNSFYITPLNRRILDDIPVIDYCKDAEKGDWVKAEVVYDEKNTASCRLIETIGKVGSAEDDIDAIVAEYNLHAPYTPEEEKLADEIEPVDVEREELTSLFCVTIDPPDAKDFDDAVSVYSGKDEDELVLGVHIADVAAWIRPGSWIDKAAKERSFTAYIPGRTLPMLPKNLTRNISLRSDKEYCFAHSVFLTVNKKTGQIKEYRRCHSKIKINHRLTFKDVEGYLSSGKVLSEWSSDLKNNLDVLCDLYTKMRAHRETAERFLNIETAEIRVLRNDSDGQILGMEKKKQGKADCLIEEFMLAANSAVAKEFANTQLPGIYRIHPEPDSEKLEDFSGFIKQVFNISTGNLSLTRGEAQKFLRQIKGHKYEEIIISFFLRAMNRALYSDKYDLHYGLGKGLYLHFTSPIRRYPDLLVHQQLLLKQLGKQLLKPDFVADTASECTALEKNNDEAYFSASDRLKLHYLQGLLSRNELEHYAAIISTVNAGGMLADVSSIGLTAYISIESIDGKYDKRRRRLVSKRARREYKPGDFIYLELVKIDFIKGTAIFKPVHK